MDHSRLFSSKIKWISLFLAVLVVFVHGANSEQINPTMFAARVETFISGNLALAAVPAFFAMSAFLFYQNFDFSRLMGKYKSRFRSLLIPFLFWNTVYMVAFYFLSRLSIVNQQPFALSWEVIVAGVFMRKFNFTYWFLEQLIVFVILSPVIYILMRNKVVAWVVYAGVLAAFCLGCDYVAGMEFKSLLFYLSGAYFGIHHRKMIVQANRITWITPATFVLSQIVFYSGLYHAQPVFAWLHALLLVISYFGFANLIAKWELPEKLQCSFEIYTLHILILETFNKLFGLVIPQDTNWILVDYFLSPFFTISIIVWVTRFIKKHLPRFHRFAFGGR